MKRPRDAGTPSTTSAQPPQGWATVNHRAAASRGLHALLLIALACGPVALGVGWFAPNQADQPRTTADHTDDAAALRPSGWAERAVAAYLASDIEATRRAFPAAADADLPGPADDAGAQGGPVRTSTVAASRIAEGYWGVTVAVSMPREDPGSAASRYFSVGVARSGAGWVAVDLPSEVAIPPAGEAPESPYDSAPLPASHPLAQTVEQWAGAYLTADGELDRYLAPDFAQTPVAPPPYTALDQVAVHTAGDPDEVSGSVQVLARAHAVGAGEVTRTLTYALELTERGDRWEVSALHPAPRVDSVPATDS